MKTMKAFVRIDPGHQKVQMTEVPVPELQSDQMLIKVKAFGVGIHDRYFIPTDVDFPYPIGTEGAGIVTKLGEQVTDFNINDRVIFTTTLQPQGGSWAEYAAAKQTAVTRLPDDLSFQKGAAVPIAGGTALECMRALNLIKGDDLFIAGASGAIGTFVIQLAAAKGIHIAASASEKNHNYMQALGAEKTVDYHSPDWTNQVNKWSKGGVTAALAIQPGTGIDSIKVVKDGGKLITVSGDSDQVTPERNITIDQMGHHDDTKQKLVQLLRTISKGEMRVVIEKEYAFEEALEALRKTETRQA